MSDHTPLTDEQLAEYETIAARVADDPFYVSDCEGSLQVWREKALTHVRRDDTGAITMYSFPSSYKVTDQVLEMDLNTWDPGEDATDDKQRQDVYDLVESRAAVSVLVNEVQRLRAELATVATSRTPRLCECGHSYLAHTVPAPHSCFAHAQTCPCPAYQQLPHDEAVAQLKRNQQAAAERKSACNCPHPDDAHSIYGCEDGCSCEWMPKRKPMDPVRILGIYADDQGA